jgi:hypothetical protein
MKIKRLNEELNFNNEDWEEEDENELKMYYLNPNGWGHEFFVCANSPEKALEYIKNYIRNMKDKNDRKFYMWILDITLDNLTGKYTLEEHKPGSVVQSEIS